MRIISNSGQGFLSHFIQILYRPRYQVSVYRTIGPLVVSCFNLAFESSPTIVSTAVPENYAMAFVIDTAVQDYQPDIERPYVCQKYEGMNIHFSYIIVLIIIRYNE